MKKIYVLLLALIASVAVFADEVPLYEEGKDDTGERYDWHKIPALIPTVSFDDAQNLYVRTTYTIDVVQIIIRDGGGDLLYSTVTVLPAGKTTFTLPLDVYEEKYSIELLYGSHHLIGYF